MSEDIIFPRYEIGNRDTTKVYFKIQNIGRSVSLIIYECKKKKNSCPHKITMPLCEASWFLDFLKSEHIKGSYKNLHPGYKFSLGEKECGEITVEKRTGILHINQYNYYSKKIDFIHLNENELENLLAFSNAINDVLKKLSILYNLDTEDKHCIISY